MKHIQSYNEHINEALSTNQRTLINLPRILGAFLVSKIFNIYPLLNFRWSEIKNKTNDSSYNTIIAHSSGTPSKMDENLTKITKNDLPSNKMGVGMFLRDWNIYLSDRKSKGGGSTERPVVYISKDEIKMGDKYLGERISDSDIFQHSDFIFSKNSKGKSYPSSLKDPAKFPLIIMIAKFDNVEKSEELEQYVDDICLDMEDEFNVEIKPNFNLQQDKLYLSIKPTKGNDPSRKNLVFTEDLAEKVESLTNRVLEFLKTEGKKGFKSEIVYMPKDLYYLGTAGRFPEIIEAAKTHDRRNDSDNYDTYRKSLRLSFCGNNFRYKKTDINTHLNTEDMKVLLKDIDNCSFSVNKPKQPLVEIPLNWIAVEIKKV